MSALSTVRKNLWNRHSPSCRDRFGIEWQIALATVRQALREGFTLILNHTDYAEDAITIQDESNLPKFMEELFACDDARPVYSRGGMSGWVYFVFGNDGWDVINDYTCNLEQFLSDAQAISDKYA